MPNYTGVSFAGNSLQTANIFVKNIDHYSIPAKNIALMTLDHDNKSSIPFTSYSSRAIVIEGVITGSSVADLDSKLDTFRSYFVSQDQNLDIDYNGSTRRYIATLDAANSQIDRPGGLLYAEFSLKFICTNPFGQDTTPTTLLNQATRTLATYNDNVTVGGTAPYQLPIITVTLTAVSATGSQTMFVGNNANGQGIYITRSVWANGDVVVINCTLKTVTVNGAAAIFSGAFPELAPGAQQIGYLDTFTSRTLTELVTQTPLYL